MLRILFFVLAPAILYSQGESALDSMEIVVKQHPVDTSGVNALNDIAWYYRNTGENEKRCLTP